GLLRARPGRRPARAGSVPDRSDAAGSGRRHRAVLLPGPPPFRPRTAGAGRGVGGAAALAGALPPRSRRRAALRPAGSLGERLRSLPHLGPRRAGGGRLSRGGLSGRRGGRSAGPAEVVGDWEAV